MTRGKKFFARLLLSLSLFASPLFCGSASAEETYQMTEDQLTQLEEVFDQLKNKQSQQETLLNQQESQIGMLKKQLNESQTAIENSQESMKKLRESLNEANQSLQQSAEEAKRTQKRLERQRNTWAFAAIIVNLCLISN